MALICRECGASVPDGQSVCPRCRSVDLAQVKGLPAAGAGGIDAYHRYQHRRRLAIAATAATTVLLMLLAIGVGLAFKQALPAAGGGTGGKGSPLSAFETVRVGAMFLLFNPIMLVGLALVLGLFSYRFWHRVVTGEAAGADFSVIEALGGRPRAQRG
jgi:hypothetical protein